MTQNPSSLYSDAHVKYPALYGSFEKLVIDVLQVIREHFGENPVWPSREVWDVKFDGQQDQPFLRWQECPGDAIYELMDKIFELPSFKTTLEELERFKDCHLLFNTQIAYVSPILRKYLSASPTVTFNKEVFNKSYLFLEHYLCATEVPAKVYMELFLLKGEVDNVTLSQTHRIRRIDHDIARRLWRGMIRADDWHRPFVSLRFVPNIDAYLFEATFMVPTAQAGRIFALLRSETERSMTALRMAYPRCGSFQYLTHEYEGFFPEFAYGSSSEKPFVRAFETPLTLDNANALQNKWPMAYDYASRLESSSETLEPFLRIAGHRFRDSFEKTDAEDRFLDYSIALEALFSKENDAISYRLPLRAAVFLGQDAPERRRVYNILNAAYRQRSQIAHGSSQLDKEIRVGGQKMLPAEFLDAVESCLFSALERLRIANSVNKDKFISAIDECILSQERSSLLF